jgi:putative chitinase
MITLDDLKRICPQSSGARLALFVEPLNAAMDEFGISENVERETAFLAQIAHESGGFHYVRELASGEAYEGREDLGNTEPGDGVRFKGRGLIQVTGRKNYGLMGTALALDLIAHPELLQQPDAACRSAGWFWTTGAGLNLSSRALERCGYGCNLNTIADTGDFEAVTLAINGGTNGYSDRLAYFERAKAALV